MSFTLFGGSEARRVRTGVVSAGFFDFFGIQAAARAATFRARGRCSRRAARAAAELRLLEEVRRRRSERRRAKLTR